jgi:hypothetical protein
MTVRWCMGVKRNDHGSSVAERRFMIRKEDQAKRP